MDAWETLLSGSSLGTGHDAWEHLLAQTGGSGLVSIGCDFSLEVHDVDYAILVDGEEIEIEVVDEECEVLIEEELFIIEVCDE